MRPKNAIASCPACGTPMEASRETHHFTESGLSSVYLQKMRIERCPGCGEELFEVPYPAKVQRAIATAIAQLPQRWDGEHLRFIRRYLGLTGEQLGQYLHTDRSKISRWEHGESIGQSTERLLRLLVPALDPEIKPCLPAITANLPLIAAKRGGQCRILIDVETLRFAFQKENPKASAA